jgi:hypothetical protein
VDVVAVGGGVLGVLSLLLLVYCLLDIATAHRSDVRTLPKPLWFVAVLPPVFGPAAWLLAGRPRRGAPRARPTVLPPASGATRAPAPDDDDAFLRELRRRADEQRRRGQDGDDASA